MAPTISLLNASGSPRAVVRSQSLRSPFRPELFWGNDDPAPPPELPSEGNALVDDIAVEGDVDALAPPELRPVDVAPALGAVDPTGGDAGSEDAQGIRDAFAYDDRLAQCGRLVEEMDVRVGKVEIRRAPRISLVIPDRRQAAALEIHSVPTEAVRKDDSATKRVPAAAIENPALERLPQEPAPLAGHPEIVGIP
jgi:hypothetical protein